MNKDLLKEYVVTVLKEEGYFSFPGTAEYSKKSSGFLGKLKSFFTGTGSADSIADSWLEDQSVYFDVELSDDFEEEVKKFVRGKYTKAVARARGDKAKASSLLKRALDKRYMRKLRELELKLNNLGDDEV